MSKRVKGYCGASDHEIGAAGAIALAQLKYVHTLDLSHNEVVIRLWNVATSESPLYLEAKLGKSLQSIATCGCNTE